MIGLLLSCSNPTPAPAATEAAATEAAADFADACEAEFELQLPPFDVHFAVLTDAEGTPQAGAESITACPEGEVDWPCSHLDALDQTFRTASGERVCDPEQPDQCITFRYKDHRFYDEVIDQGQCTGMLSAARRKMTPALDSSQIYADLRAGALACTDADILDPAAINIFLFDNPITGIISSFATAHTSRWSACAPYIFIEHSRLPATPGEAFAYGVNQHEMGHIFGLDHLCMGLDDPTYPATNIMQGTGSSCCCECGDARGYDPEGVWQQQVCYDCSAAEFGDRCTERPGEQCEEPQCQDKVSTGDRSAGFSAAQIGDAATGADQITVMIAQARDLHACWCAADRASGARRWVVHGETSCTPGSGRFSLVPFADRHIPLLIEGDPLSPLAMLQTAEGPRPLPLDWGEPGEVSLRWDCDDPGPTFTSRRPAAAYLLPLRALGWPGEQALVLRLDTARQKLWVELQGQPGVFEVLNLTPAAGEWRWRWRKGTTALQGTLAVAGQQLQLRILGGQHGAHTLPAQTLMLPRQKFPMPPSL